MQAYTWVMRQVGKHGVWQPYQLAGLPHPPDIDDKVTIQRWATPECRLGETHKAAFTLDFDAHADWLSVAVCLDIMDPRICTVSGPRFGRIGI